MATGGKTEKATPKKREDERKKGNVFQSKDVSSAVGLMACAFVLKLIISPMLQYIKKMISDGLTDVALKDELTARAAVSIITEFAINVVLLVAPLGLVAASVGFLAGGIQTRFLFKMSKLKPKFSRLNPVSGLQKTFSLKSVVDLLKSVIKVIIITSVIYTQIKAKIPELATIPLMDINRSLSWIGDSIYDIVMKIALYMAFFAAADYFYQWWEYEKQIMMTKQEIKDEYKQTEGDPQLKGRIKDVQHKMATMRMMKKIPQADVVIRNPTHYAVALKYNPPKDKAPMVVAKGKDYIALKIVEIAEKNGVHITENVPLAQGLYAAVEIDRPIPEEFYRPVAEVLAFIYKLKKTKKRD